MPCDCGFTEYRQQERQLNEASAEILILRTELNAMRTRFEASQLVADHAIRELQTRKISQ